MEGTREGLPGNSLLNTSACAPHTQACSLEILPLKFLESLQKLANLAPTFSMLKALRIQLKGLPASPPNWQQGIANMEVKKLRRNDLMITMNC